MQGCCKPPQEFLEDEVSGREACAGPSQKNSLPASEETELVEQIPENVRGNTNWSSAPIQTNFGAIQVLKKQFRTEKNWRTFCNKALAKEKNSNPSKLEIAGTLEQLAKNLPSQPTSSNVAQLLRYLLEIQDCGEGIPPHCWHVVCTVLTKPVSAKEMIPYSGFGITANRMCELAAHALCLPNVEQWTFQLHGGEGMFGTSQEVCRVNSSSLLMSKDQKLYVVDSVASNCDVEMIVRRSKLIDLQLRQGISMHILKREDMEEIIDCAKFHFRDQVMTWVCHTQAMEVLKRRPSCCTLCGICPRPLSLVAEYFESQSLFVTLKAQRRLDARKRWSWLDRIRTISRIAKCVMQFHTNGLAHLTLTPKNVLVNSQMEVRLKLETSRQDQSACLCSVPFHIFCCIRTRTAESTTLGGPVCNVSYCACTGLLMAGLLTKNMCRLSNGKGLLLGHQVTSTHLRSSCGRSQVV